MELPDIWLLFGAYIHQDFLLDHPDFVSGIREIVGSFSEDQRSQLLTYLAGLVDSSRSGQELAEIWRASGASFLVADDDAREFLRSLILTIEST